MGCPAEVEIGENLTFSICTHDPDTGALADADAAPAYRIYEDETAGAILTGTMAKLDDGNTLGFYTELIACTAANGFEDGKSYTVYITAAVDGDTGGICYGFRALTPIYQAKVWLYDDEGNTTDRYECVWHKNGQPIFSGITNPTIQVIKAADGADLVGAAAMSQIAALGMYRYDEAVNRIVAGVAYLAQVEATIDLATRTWVQPVGRDSAA